MYIWGSYLAITCIHTWQLWALPKGVLEPSRQMFLTIYHADTLASQDKQLWFRMILRNIEILGYEPFRKPYNWALLMFQCDIDRDPKAERTGWILPQNDQAIDVDRNQLYIPSKDRPLDAPKRLLFFISERHTIFQGGKLVNSRWDSGIEKCSDSTLLDLAYKVDPPVTSYKWSFLIFIGVKQPQ